jgi:hypothetical protein
LLKASSHASQTGHIRRCQRRSTPGVQPRTSCSGDQPGAHWEN